MIPILKKGAVTEKSISSNTTQFTLVIFQNDVTLIWTYFNNPLPLCHAPVLYVICTSVTKSLAPSTLFSELHVMMDPIVHRVFHQIVLRAGNVWGKIPF